MLFNSLHFVFFFPIVVTIYFLIPPQRRWIVLLVASYYFYMSWRPIYAVLILFSTVVDYYCSQQMERQSTQRQKRPYLWLSLTANLGLLFIFKYLGFFADSIATLAGNPPAEPLISLILPVGISFYTFQTLSYTIDVYQGKTKAEPEFGRFALFVSFFPQLVAGPIERSQDLLPQLRKAQLFSFDALVSGGRLMLWGFFKKLVIADRLASAVNVVYNDLDGKAGTTLMLATLFFAIQIYCDFSGYSDIAIGTARILGINLNLNFRRPYLATNIRDFWSRWHISLTTWFRDYVYIPLGGNRTTQRRWLTNIAIIFVVSGLWHGANWTFVAWGVLHGTYYIVWILYRKWRPQPAQHIAWQVISRVLTLLFVVFAWIFFRANTFTDAIYIVTHLGQNLAFTIDAFNILGIMGTVIVAINLAILFSVEIGLEYFNLDRRFLQLPRPVRWTAYYGLIGTILLFGVFSSSEFVYFQF